MKLTDINIDNYIGMKIVDTDIFKNTNPNIITLVGIILNLAIYFLLKNGDILLANIICITRCLCDILDGNVARKYNKTSKLGGFLDTLCDFMLIQIYFKLIVCKYTDNPLIISLILIVSSLTNIYVMRDSITDHSNLEKTDTIIDKLILIFFKNNTFIVYFILFYINSTLFKKIDK
jgi:phosphatidylglycerophosphate synthase